MTLKNEIENWIQGSTNSFNSKYVASKNRIWVLKFFPPKYLRQFIFDNKKRILISRTPGFTWGDGVYVTPIKHAYSAMFFGRVGVMGWINSKKISRVYDAGDSLRKGIQLYQKWIVGKSALYDELTTTIHSEIVNQQLRNEFRQLYNIDLVVFPPDEINHCYTQPLDRWFLVSEWPSSPRPIPLSETIQNCQWVLIVTEDFVRDENDPRKRLNLFGQHLYAVPAHQKPDLTDDLINKYMQNSRTVGSPHHPNVLQIAL